MKKTVSLFAATLALFAASSHASTTVAGYSINDAVGLTADTLAPDVTSTALTSTAWTLDIAVDDFINIPESAGMADGTTDDMSGAFSAGQFLEFTVSTSSTSYVLDELQMTLGRGSNGPQDYGIRISTDGFAGGNTDTGLASFNLSFNQAVSESADLKTISLSGLTLDSSTDYTFRVAMDDRAGNGSGGSAGRFYDITLTAVPEPGTYALLAGCLALSAVMVRRRRS